jgi:alpha-L-fucosidase
MSALRLALATVAAFATLAVPGHAQEPDYTPDPASLRRHQAPQWFNDAKLGYFIHWGAYSVPAWAPASGGRAYAEWYWNELHVAGSPTQQHHRDVYGEEFPYDRFIEQWKAERFDPDAWLRLFVEGGAKYFVLVSKHHDGVALFDTATTGRDTVELGPRRDFVRELFDAADRGDYGLKRGLYYSLPEWFHPNGPATSGTWGQGPPTNPFTGAPVPYTGYTPISSYVDEHQYPQMLELIDRYDPDILWCDIGGPNRSNEVMAHFFNQAKNRPVPKEVTVDNRCGNGVFDFTTPEYRVEPDINPAKWEATRGIGRSFGYNAREDEDDYLTANDLIDSFVDIVSKNGNLLLNLGPMADGTIPEIQAERVRALGDWLDVNGQAIYGTTYWSRAEDPKSNVPVRYTVKDDALYVTALEWPGERLTLSGGLPLDSATAVTLLGSDGERLRWRREGDAVAITMPRQGAAATPSRHAYTFKIVTPGVRQVLRTSVELPKAADLGYPFTARVKVTNPASTDAPDGRITLDVPQGWSVTPERAIVDGIPAGESRTVEFTVTAPDDAEPARYALTAHAAFGRIAYEAQGTILVGFDNVALGKHATQKSLYQGSTGNPERAVDGNTDGVWRNGSVTHTAQPETEAWWQVDLGRSYPLSEIALWNRTDCCSDRLSRYYVLVSDQPFTSDSLQATLSQPGVRAFYREETAGRPTRFPLGLTGRYVRVQLTSTSNPLSLAEVEVLAAQR